MNVVIRVDASLEMGSGHVMRCLTLARALRERGHHCVFICREHPGHLNGFVRDQGFEVHALPLGQCQDTDLFHSHWLGASQDEDLAVCAPMIAAMEPHWLVVDHYGLDRRWEVSVTPSGCRVLVIDDLADRPHQCDVLLDQNLGKLPDAYRVWVPQACQVLTGPHNALLRPEFALLRATSLAQRDKRLPRHILLTLGGVDQHNLTGAIIDALKECELPVDVRLTVVMGSTAPHLDAVRGSARSCPWPVEVLSGISDMAQRMSEADLAIGAGGGTSWERCCLGLPALLVILAENQKPAGLALQSSGAVELIDPALGLRQQLRSGLTSLLAPQALAPYVKSASQITDGRGAERMVRVMECG